jgi:phosphonate transport system permease protein
MGREAGKIFEKVSRGTEVLLDAFSRWAESQRIRLLPPILDLLFLGYLWFATSIAYGYFRFGKLTYSLLPWEWMVVVVVLAAALWSACDQTLGMKVVRHELSREKPGAFAFVYALLWPLFPLVLITGFLDKKGRTPAELASGLCLSEVKVWVHRPWQKTLSGWLVVFSLMATTAAAVAIARVEPSRLVTGFEKTIKFWRAIFSPNWDLATLGLKLLGETLFMAVVATALAVPIAAALSFFAARNLMQGPIARPIYVLLRMIGSFTRSVDAIIWAIIFAVWVGTGSFAGVLALWIHSIVDLMKLYGEQIEAIDPGPVEALTATGANRLQVIRYAVIPQIINPFLSFTLYRWDINVRMATVVGVVGGGGIGFRLYQYLRSWAFPEATVLTILIVVMVWAIDWLSARLREKLA